MNPSFWEGRRVFLTGHTGFKGSWLSLWLGSMGARVTGYALAPPTSPSLFDSARVGEGMQSIIADVCDAATLSAALREARPEIVIHMAAQALVRYSYDQPVQTYATNVMGTVNVLEAVRQTGGVRAVVVVTSDKCYDNREWPWGYRENEPMGGHDPYSNSKGCAELVTAAYRDSFFAPARWAEHGTAVASARAGNVIGGGDWALDRLVPDLLRGIAAGEEVVIRSPGAIRPWQHVLEPLCGYLTLAERLYEEGSAFGEGWNFGPHDEDAQPVAWIADALTSMWGPSARYRIDAPADAPHEANYLKLDCSKARQRLHWHPRWRLREALVRICDWQRAYLEGQDMHAVTLAQIRQYAAASLPV
ncbi:MAG: CDP-glucose 4,6-dehydratase [Rhodocyclaceae bacterium]